MYSKKSVEPRMKPWRTPTLTEYFCEDFPSRKTQKPSITKKRRNKAK